MKETFSSIKKKVDALNRNGEAKFGLSWVKMLLKDEKKVLYHRCHY